MQDKYAGDVGDFGKFVMLDQINRITLGELRLGINWYLTTRVEPNSNDGRHVAYLNATNPSATRFEHCNPDIYEKLRDVVKNERSVRALENNGILPTDTIFFSAGVPFGSSTLAQRISLRELWLKQSLEHLQEADVLFLDPDNGIQTPNVRKTQMRAMKYAFVDEIREYFDCCNILVIYSHRDRTPANEYMQRFVTVANQLNNSVQMKIIRFKRVSVRDYFFLYKKPYTSIVHELLTKLTTAPFDFMFEQLVLT
jgi:hypothetical protein